MLLAVIAVLLAAQPQPEPAKPVAQPAAKGPAAAPEAPPSAPEPGIDSDGVEIASAALGAVHTPSSAQAFGGVQQYGADHLSQRVADYNLEAVLDPVKHTVEGKERLTWTNRSDKAISHLYVHLYLNAFEGPASTFNSEKARYGGFRTGVETKKGEWGYLELKKVQQGGAPVPWRFVHPDGGPATDHTVAVLDLPQPIPPGGKGVIDFDFHDQLPRVIARTGYFDTYHLVGQWYPKVGVLELPGERGATRPRWNCHELHLNSEFYADFGTYRAEITVPRGYTVGATGVEIAPPVESAQGLTHKLAQDDIHDFVFTAWDKFAPPLEGDTAVQGRNVHMKVLYPPEFASSGRVTLQATLDSIRYFSDTLGPYPYPQVTAVVVPHNALESGGMEYETFFTTVGGPEGSVLATFSRYTTVHEFGHGYFMGLLATNEFEEPFLDEGLNEWWDTRMLANETFSLAFPGVLGKAGLSLPKTGYWDMERLEGVQRHQADPIAGNSWDRFSRGSYGLVYMHTTMVFHDLEKLLGGDVMARAMKEYYRRWHHRHPSTADLEETVAEVAAEQAPLVRRWFAEQVYERRAVDDRVETVEAAEVLPESGLALQPDGSRKELDEKDLSKEIREQREAFKKAHPDAKPSEPGPFPWRSIVQARRYGAHVPQKLLVTFEDGSTQTETFALGERWHRWVFEGPLRVKSAQLDPERERLLDLSKLDDGRTRESDHTASHRWTLEFKAWSELAFAMLEAL